MDNSQIIQAITDLQNQVKQLSAQRVGTADILPAAIKPQNLQANTANNIGDMFYVDKTGSFQKFGIGTTGSVLTTAASIPIWLTPGSNGQILTLSGGLPIWSSPSTGFSSGASVYLSASQSIANGVGAVKVTFDTALYDSLTEFDLVTNHRFVVATTGRYLVVFNPLSQGFNAGAGFVASIYKNGVSVGNTTSITGSSGFQISAPIFEILSLTAGDYIEFFVSNQDSASRSLQSGTTSTYAMVQRVL